MVRVGEHVDRLHRLDPVGAAHQRQVAGLRGGVAAHVDDPLRRGAQDHVENRLVDTRTRRVEDDDIRTSVRRNERVVEHLLHVPGVEGRVADAVQRGVDLRIGDRLGNIFDAHHPGAVRRAEVGDGSRAGIEVVERVGRLQVGKPPRHLVEFVGLRGVGLVERLRPYLEAQPFHLFDDVVLAAVAHRLEVARRVVELRVDDVEERGDLRKTLREVVEQRLAARPVVGAEDHDRHHLARRGRAHDHVAHEPRVCAGVVERVAVLEAEALRLQADGIRRLGLQPAPPDVEHLVEHVGNVESQGRRSLQVGAARHLLAREPAAVGEGELQLVAVELRRGGAEAGGDFGKLEPPDAGQLVADLRPLQCELLFVGEILPLAAPADTEVFAEGFHAQRRTPHVAHDVALHEAAAFHADLHVDDIARDGHRHEDHHVVPTTHGLALGGQRRDFKPLDQGVVRFLSCHRFGFRSAKVAKYRTHGTAYRPPRAFTRSRM